ncbi:DUF695 domain-containing protein [Mycobacteroides sp. LB1]|uniref:DUF695 domain-containing protein n=1 Tax=Mycobacteroides sp. LB1 TaxID=2750814 RepID=UPI0015DDA374|nr:DUF695 domain-containing protein [Mycobacteroides sp. LB1]
MSQILYGSWDIYTRSDENSCEVIAFDFEAAKYDLSDDLPYCALIKIDIKNPGPSGEPVEPEAEVLYDMQDALVSRLAQDGAVCRLVARVTHSGVRELIFGVATWEEFGPPVGQWLSEHDTYVIDVFELPDWSFYDEYVRPTTETLEYLEDRQTVDHIVKSGVDPSECRVIDFFFYGTLVQLAETSQVLRQRQYSADDMSTDDREPGRMCLEAHKHMTLDELYDETRLHRELARQQGIIYDGWGTSIASSAETASALE